MGTGYALAAGPLGCAMRMRRRPARRGGKNDPGCPVQRRPAENPSETATLNLRANRQSEEKKEDEKYVRTTKATTVRRQRRKRTAKQTKTVDTQTKKQNAPGPPPPRPLRSYCVLKRALLVKDPQTLPPPPRLLRPWPSSQAAAAPHTPTRVPVVEDGAARPPPLRPAPAAPPAQGRSRGHQLAPPRRRPRRPPPPRQAYPQVHPHPPPESWRQPRHPTRSPRRLAQTSALRARGTYSPKQLPPPPHPRALAAARRQQRPPPPPPLRLERRVACVRRAAAGPRG